MNHKEVVRKLPCYDEAIDADLKQYLEGMENRLREYIDEHTHDTETRIVLAFGAYQETAAVRFRKIEADVSNVNSSTTQQMDLSRRSCWT